jgi:hypothetical protein
MACTAISRGGPSKGHGCTHVHPIIFAKQSKLVVIIHVYTPVIRFRSDYEWYVRVWAGARFYLRIRLRFGRTASQSRKGGPRGGNTWCPGGARRVAK